MQVDSESRLSLSRTQMHICFGGSFTIGLISTVFGFFEIWFRLLEMEPKLWLAKYVLPEPGPISYFSERRMRYGFALILPWSWGYCAFTDWVTRASDMVMKACLNGRERDLEQWTHLFAEADSRFKFKGVIRIPGSRWSVIEAIWEKVAA